MNIDHSGQEATAAGALVELEVGEATPELIARAGAGDQAAARALVDQLRPMVLRIVRARRPKRVAEEDLMQEVFMKMFARLEQYQGDAPFSHWVSRIAVTTCLDHGRSWQRRPELRWADLEEWETEFLGRVTDDAQRRRPGDVLATGEFVEKLLGRLKAEDRRVVVLFELEQRSILEICEETGWTFEFTKMRLFRARRKLCRMIATAGGLDGALWGLSAANVPVWKGRAA
ncbi:MAG: sigma-70 family RNA polymerase sigma factor [Verrucomicrobia bacterium]|nr:sigma-70 family RNA polymerase sigma factor [Verrucomicrobiota bacterium]